jgi:hypothetical protein
LFGCAAQFDKPRKPKSTLFIGVDANGSFGQSGHYDSALLFLAHYIYGHLNELGELDRPQALFVAGVGGKNLNEPKAFHPIHDFEGKDVTGIEADLRTWLPPTDTVTDFKPFFREVARITKARKNCSQARTCMNRSSSGSGGAILSISASTPERSNSRAVPSHAGRTSLFQVWYNTFVEQALFFSDPYRRKVAAILAIPEQPTDRIVVLCHGFLSHKNSTTNTTLTRLLTDKGIATFRFDFCGMGESAGPFEDITVAAAVGQALAALECVANRGFRRIGLVGSSFGGLVSILAASRWPGTAGSRLACLALKCPVVDFAEELRLEFGDDEMAKWKTTDTIPNILGGSGRIPLRYAFYEDCLRHIVYDPAASITAPTLIVQGDQDEHVPPHQSRRLYAALRIEKCLEIVPGADHQFTKAEDFRTMTQLISEWLIRYLSRVEE